MSKKLFFILIITIIFVSCTQVSTNDRENVDFRKYEKKEDERLRSKCLRRLSEGKSSYECRNINYQNDF